MHTDGKAISDANPQPDADPNTDGPFLPSYIDLFHCYLANSAEAAVALLKAQNADQGAKKLGADNVLKADAIAAIAAHPKFKGHVDATTTVDDLVRQTEGLLATGLKGAFDLIKQFAPEQVPPPPAPGAGPAPWFQVALQEKGKVENNAPADVVRNYFKATDFGGRLDPLPAWCGAFVAHCIEENSQWRAGSSWRGLGDNLEDIGREFAGPALADTPIGAIVVLSGHVSFFSGINSAAGKVKLLGGNQTHGVNETPFPLSQVVSVRWFDVSGGAGTGTGPARKFNYPAVTTTRIAPENFQYSGT